MEHEDEEAQPSAGQSASAALTYLQFEGDGFGHTTHRARLQRWPVEKKLEKDSDLSTGGKLGACTHKAGF